MKLKSKKYLQHTGKVYDIGVQTQDHSYSVNGAIVHNSAGGSLVSYLLGIIQIDPIEFDLLFERFLNVGRMGELRDCPAFEIKTDLENIILTEGSLIKIVRNQKESIIFVEDLLEGDKIINYN
jgi:DNA polymerase-3 subunit alpha